MCQECNGIPKNVTGNIKKSRNVKKHFKFYGILNKLESLKVEEFKDEGSDEGCGEAGEFGDEGSDEGGE